MSDQITKNQHYVPQFLLKGFDLSMGNIARINILDVERDVIRKGQSVSEVFSQNYFYDKDNLVENFLSSHIETPASVIIGRFRQGDFSSLNNGGTELIKFLCCQNSRTVEAREDALRFVNAHVYQLSVDLARFNGWSDIDLEKIKLMPADKDAMRSFNSSLALSGVIDSKGMEDLRFHLLINETGKDFIISDHAVSRYNWFYRGLNDPGVGSLLIKGVQLYLPISNRLCLCAYDSKVYKFGSRSSDVSALKIDQDVDWLNQLQMRNAHSFVAFSSMGQAEYIRKLRLFYWRRRIYSRESLHLGEKKMAGGEIKTTHLVYTDQVRLAEKPTFFKVIRRARQHEFHVEERSPEISEALMMLKRSAREDRL